MGSWTKINNNTWAGSDGNVWTKVSDNCWADSRGHNLTKVNNSCWAEGGVGDWDNTSVPPNMLDDDEGDEW